MDTVLEVQHLRIARSAHRSVIAKDMPQCTRKLDSSTYLGTMTDHYGNGSLRLLFAVVHHQHIDSGMLVVVSDILVELAEVAQVELDLVQPAAVVPAIAVVDSVRISLR